jgi:spermidine/putrescine transport system ATP-binding protein
VSREPGGDVPRVVAATIRDSGSPADPAVEVEHLSRLFGDVPALDDVSLTVRRGEFFSLLGPSGCGKTTLLRIVGGFDTATRGEVRIHGRDVLNEPPYLRRTNMIFQHLALFPHMTVFENVAFGLEMKRMARAEIRRNVDEMLALVRLEGLESRAIDQLSGGQKQRVAMARALVNKPDVLLLDEPLGALDLQLRLRMQFELRRLQQALGSTFIFVTHDQGEAITMSDRIAVMNQGRLVQVGSPIEVYELPEHRFVAEFMGHSNLIAGVVQSCTDGYGVLDAAPFRIEGRCRKPLAVGTLALVAVRYEKVDVRPGSSGGDGLPARIVHLRYMGATVRIEAAVNDGLTIRSEMPTGPRVSALAAGQEVLLTWPRDSAVLIETQTKN